MSELKGKKITSISGIAVPESFENFLTGFGAELIHKERYADHHKYSRSEIVDFLDKSKELGAEMVLTTEKRCGAFFLSSNHTLSQRSIYALK